MRRNTNRGWRLSLLAAALPFIAVMVSGAASILQAGDSSSPPRPMIAAAGGQVEPAAYLPLVSRNPKTGVIYRSLTHDGRLREYILYVPSGYNGRSPVPLILNFHAYGRDAAHQMAYGDLRPVAESAGAIIAHPQGTLWNGNSHWNVGAWMTGSTADDVGFSAALIDDIAGRYNIDLARVYSTGFSQGGHMSYLLACQLSGRVAAIAAVAGAMTFEVSAGCDPQRPLPVLQIHGTEDAIVPYGGDRWTEPVEDGLGYWTGHNGGDGLFKVTPLPDLDPTDGSTVERWVDDGTNQISTEFLRVLGGQHAWPGSAVFAPGTNYDIDASLEIWNFFAKYDINGPTN